jgi:hypothetical protein
LNLEEKEDILLFFLFFQPNCSAGRRNMISIKPHHFVDIVTACGDGRTEFQPHPYGHAVHSVAKEILANPDVNLRIEFGADDVCHPCRHNVDGLCDDAIDTSFRPQASKSKREYNLLMDQRWAIDPQNDNAERATSGSPSFSGKGVPRVLHLLSDYQ